MSDIKSFILHLRLNYNFLILSAPFLLGALYVPHISNIKDFLFLFILLYIFLFGGANLYNSYFDKDEGPIGGLERPPNIKKWMYYTAWSLQIIGLILSLFVNLIFGLLVIFSVILSWLYSSPTFRFKGKPILSFVVVGIGTVFNTTIMGYLAAGGDMPTPNLILGSLGVTLIVLSMYPFSQVYQIDEDIKRGDVTFAVKYGIHGIKKNYLILFLLGVILLACSFIPDIFMAITVLTIGILAYIFIWQSVRTISVQKQGYKKVMKTKYISGIAFTLIVMILLII